MRGLFGEFKAFILRGNVVDLAVGVIIGAAACVGVGVLLGALAIVRRTRRAAEGSRS